MRMKLAAALAFAIGSATSGPMARADANPAGEPERRVFYGDLHLHTSYSLDAYVFGIQTDPEQAYRFARGEAGRYLEVEVDRSTPPLDFAAVTDHAELLGAALASEHATANAMEDSEVGKAIERRDARTLTRLGWPSKLVSVPGVDVKAMIASAWQREVAAANRYNEPGRFTAFIAYEWTAQSDGRSLHRNVIFQGNRAPDPFTSADSAKPEDLWRFLENIRKQGFEALAIPHNPNLSNGGMFDRVDSEGRPIDSHYASLRSDNEPLFEIVQNKGQSEARPALSPNDEFAGFEVFDGFATAAVKALPGNYARDALGRGLQIEQAQGVNPFRYGFVGGSDFHNGLSNSAEDAYAGTYGSVDPNRQLPDLDDWMKNVMGYRTKEERQQAIGDLYRTGSGGLTAVWAEQNSRESIYRALRRRETFATSGTRLKLRFFAGCAFRSSLLKSHDWVKQGYRAGVPMGATLRCPASQAPPRFIVWAQKDPDGANLDRIQIVKIQLKGGRSSESIYDTVLSEGRRLDSKMHIAPAVGNTVDLRTGRYTNTIGARELSAIWQDPEFDPHTLAVYYVRVLEIPTPRWTTLAAVKQGRALPEGVPATLQERAWSSPIWVEPRAH